MVGAIIDDESCKDAAATPAIDNKAAHSLLESTLSAVPTIIQAWVDWKDARGRDSPHGLDHELLSSARLAARDASTADALFAQLETSSRKPSVRQRWTQWRQNFAASKLHILRMVVANLLSYHGHADEAAQMHALVADAIVAGDFHVACRGPQAPSRRLAEVPRCFEDAWCERGLSFTADMIKTKHSEALSIAIMRTNLDVGNVPARELFERARLAVPHAVPWTHHQQLPAVFTPGLAAKPIWPRDEHPAWLAVLEQHAHHITANLSSLIRQGRRWASELDAVLVDQSGPEQGWSEWLLFDGGHWHRESCALFAETCELLARLPGLTGWHREGEFVRGMCTILRLKPGAHLKPHFGITNQRLTAHLGLIIPEGPTITVGNTTTSWTEGKVLLFDDSFVHSVISPSWTTDRYVLLMQMWHPSLPEPKPAKLQWYAERGRWHPLLDWGRCLEWRENACVRM